MIPLFDAPERMSAAARGHRAAGRRIGLVPTMGALHEGHLTLVRAARAENDEAIVSIFVNPLQFGPGEDLERYPRDLDGDLRKLEAAGATAAFTPTPATMYPAGFATHVVNDAVSARLEGALRPGHFRGVLTVVAKLFHVVGPDAAYFGQKDAQQAFLVRRMVRDLAFPLEVRILPIVREPDGLAMSSRNAFLGAEGRARAVALSRALDAARACHEAGERNAGPILEAARSALLKPGIDVDYVELVDTETFEPVEDLRGAAILVLAARVDGVRLLDNIRLEPRSDRGRSRP